MLHQNQSYFNVWALVARSCFQGRIWEISNSIFRENVTWLMRMSLRTSWINRSSLVGRKPCERKKKKIKVISRRQIPCFQFSIGSYYTKK
ncbi:hypothetical protein MtrunA17_Chr2g0315831 [Medicago truncatula]|uniref:Uncharacterized protein n=1 Tax=Medicago truncatula TaxID=3880 RepID=A0A396JIQ0_MEDTR|nr:hypothetical protein MtrunA17_Chr2g0315831 [Medicago truncatula]